MTPRLQAIDGYREALATAIKQGVEHEVERELAKNDLFYLLTVVLGRGKAAEKQNGSCDHDWIFARCREVEKNPNGYIDLWARGHFKSTLITFGLTIKDILNDPEITVGIFSCTRPIAKAFLRQIKQEFESNDKLKLLFPDILWENPERQAPKWSEDDGIVVRRRGNPKESTVEAWGLVDAQPTSKHFQLMVYDDVVTPESVTTPEMIAKVTSRWEMSGNLGTVGAATRIIGTRYHFNDTYRAILDRQAAIPRCHPITYDGKVDGEPVLWTREQVADRRRRDGMYTFGSQMLLDPTADQLQGFKHEWLRHYKGKSEGDGMNVYIIVDAANSKRKESDFTAIGVIGLGSDQNYYLLDGIRDKISLTQRGDALFSLHRRWRPRGVGYEEYGMQSDIEYIRDRMGRENYRFEITKLAGRMPKPDRIRRMIPIFENSRFWLPETLPKPDFEGINRELIDIFIREEYLPFPVGLHDDFFDMMSRIVDEELGVIWPKPNVTKDRYARPRQERRATSAWAA